MNLSSIKLTGILKTSAAPIATADASISSEQVSTNSDALLCQQCEIKPRASHTALLCHTCLEENKDDAKKVLPVPQPSQMIEPQGDANNATVGAMRSMQFAPISVRYDGKALDELAIAMMPALPEDMKAQIRELSVKYMREFVNGNPTLMDLEATAAFFSHVHEFMKALAQREKDKIILKAKPELKRLEKERKEKEKEQKIQKSLPKGDVAKHTANIVLRQFVDIVAPIDASQRKHLVKFLDYVALQMNIEDTIDAPFLQSLLSKPAYAMLKPYFKFK